MSAGLVKTRRGALTAGLGDVTNARIWREKVEEKWPTVTMYAWDEKEGYLRPCRWIPNTFHKVHTRKAPDITLRPPSFVRAEILKPAYSPAKVVHWFKRFAIIGGHDDWTLFQVRQQLGLLGYQTTHDRWIRYPWYPPVDTKNRILYSEQSKDAISLVRSHLQF